VGGARQVKETRQGFASHARWNGDCLNERAVVGRITEAHLSEAEKTFPGICRLYRGMSVKPATFLQLVWHYEAREARSTQRHARRAAR
jgi:hypothetical protein